MPLEQQLEILEILSRHEVDFIVVGGVAAVLLGAPLNTFDTDIVHARNPENIERLVGALAEVDAYYRQHPELLMGKGHHLFATTAGSVDVLSTVTEGRDYDTLLADSAWTTISGGFGVRIITLEMLIQLKREADRDKDRAVLPVLLALQKEREKAG